MFKKIQMSYETLSSPIARQAYDIENNFNDGSDNKGPVDQTIYEDTTSNRSYYQPKQQKDFYHTAWTNYEKPDWYDPYNGLDQRSEYLYLRRIANTWPKLDMAYEFIELNRLLFYMLGFGLFNIIDLYRDFVNWRQKDVELELLNTSFNLESMQAQRATSMLSMVQGLGDEEGDDNTQFEIDSESIQQYLQQYIEERQEQYSQPSAKD